MRRSCAWGCVAPAASRRFFPNLSERQLIARELGRRGGACSAPSCKHNAAVATGPVQIFRHLATGRPNSPEEFTHTPEFLIPASQQIGRRELQ
jgi:hypothetical protein